MSLTIQQHQLIKFAICTLSTLQDDPDWSSSTLDTIQASAADIGLADSDDEGMFQVKPHVNLRVPEAVDFDEYDELSQWRVAVTMKEQPGDLIKITCDEVIVWAKSDEENDLTTETVASKIAIKKIAQKYNLKPADIQDREFITECLPISFWIMGPDGFPTTREPLHDTASAIRHISEWTARYAEKGYYLDSGRNRIPITNIHQHLQISHNPFG